MKKNNLLFALCVGITSLVLFSSYTNGIYSTDYTGNSGMPGGGSSCGSPTCHGGMTGADINRLNVRVLNSAGQAMTSYSPATTYTVEISLKVNNSIKAGFQSVVCLFAGTGGGAGTASNTIQPNATQQTVINNTNYISHTTAGTTSNISGGYAKWQYKWVAPATNVGAISLATACNITNNNGAISGDSAFNSVTILQAPNAIKDEIFSTSFKLFPVPAASYICLNNPTAEVAKISITNINGAVVKSIDNYNCTQASKIDITPLASGFYTMHIYANNKTAIKYFSKN